MASNRERSPFSPSFTMKKTASEHDVVSLLNKETDSKLALGFKEYWKELRPTLDISEAKASQVQFRTKKTVQQLFDKTLFFKVSPSLIVGL